MLTLFMNQYKKSSEVTLSHLEKLRVNDNHFWGNKELSEKKLGSKRNSEGRFFKGKEMLGKESFWKLSQNMSHWIASLSSRPALEGAGGTNNNERNGGAGEMKKYDGGARFLRDVDDPQWDEHKLCALHIMMTVLTMLTPLTYCSRTWHP